MSETTPAAAPKKGNTTLVIAAVAVVALLGGGGGAYWFFMRGQPVAAKEAAPEPEEERGIVGFEPFIVNLADPGGSRFLRLTVKLVVENPEHAKELEENLVTTARMRSAVLDLLALQTADVLVTPEGKDELKKAITERVGHLAHETKVIDVLFSEFVVQF